LNVSESFDFRQPNHFTAGAVGEPGRRVFYLQAAEQSRVVSLKIEKQQVAALATFLQTVLEDLPAPEGEPTAPALLEPAEPDWIVGQIAVGVDEATNRVVLVVEELVPDLDDDTDDEVDDTEDDLLEALIGEVASEGATLRVHVTLEQAAGFVAMADELMQRGRPSCRLCGQPVDPSGHACPRLN
jgi:uncharacterized repeat protein (TIGR03847 family)